MAEKEKIEKAVAKDSSLQINAEIFKLNPSALVTLFEIDLTDVIANSGNSGITILEGTEDGILRFHNNLDLFKTSLTWQGNEYRLVPITAEGFETNSQGSLPTPKLSISVTDEGIPQLRALKKQIFELGELTGAKVTRIRTFVKYLDEVNFSTRQTQQDIVNPTSDPPAIPTTIGVYDANNTFSDNTPDTNAELPRDIYVIDRKSVENKNSIQYELTSAFDVEGIKLPGRLVSVFRCPWIYRWEGCLYEYNDRREDEIHDREGRGELLTDAPPVATDNDEKIVTILDDTEITSLGRGAGYDPRRLNTYQKGEVIFISRKKIKYYFVCKSTGPTKPPPDKEFWLQDACSKTIKGCKLRFGSTLPHGGFPGTNRNIT